MNDAIPTPDLLFSYFQCSQCGMVHCNPTFPSTNPRAACPSCGKAGRYYRSWPDIVSFEWVKRIVAFEERDDFDKQIKCVLICSFAERLLASLLATQLSLNGVTSDEVETLFRSHRGRSGLTELFKKRTGSSLRCLFERGGFAKVYVAWDNVRPVRDGLVHGGLPGEHARLVPAQEDLDALMPGILDAFRYLHNCVVPPYWPTQDP